MDQPALDQPYRRKRKPFLKWILLGLGGAVLFVFALLSLSGYLLEQYELVVTDPAKVESLAQDILQFEKPAGYRGAYSVAMGKVKSVMLTSDSDGGKDSGYILLMPISRDVPKECRVAMNEYREKKGFSETGTEQLRTETFKVRGMDTPAQIALSSPKGSFSKKFQYTIVLDGKSGRPVALSICGSDKQQSHAWVQEVLDSVK